MARKPKAPKPELLFTPAPAVETLAYELMTEYYPHLLEMEVKIQYVFRSETARVNGRDIYIQVRKENALVDFYGRLAASGDEPVSVDDVSKPFFAIVVSHKFWQNSHVQRRRAYLDNALSRCWARLDRNGNLALKIVRPDFEDFYAVVERQGHYNRTVKRMAASMAIGAQICLEFQD